MAKEKKMKKGGFDYTKMLVLFTLVPLIIAVLAISFVMVSISSKEIKETTHNGMLALIEETGLTFDYTVENSKITMKAFASAPIIRERLKNPNDAKVAAAAEQYTKDFFAQLDGWEGIYLADWNSQVMTHPVDALVGRVMREGDPLKSLQDSMLAAEDGVFNTGIIESPASGLRIMSMYAPIFDTDGKTPIGYVGAGTFVNSVAEKIVDVSSLDLKTAYVYFVDAQGIMLFHPDETKIGNSVENAAVKGLVEKLANGEVPEPECIEYEYKGANKYAAYYIGENSHYIAVLTADEKDALSTVSVVVRIAIIIAIILIVVFTILVIVLTRVIVAPLKKVTKAMQETAEGSLNADTNIKSSLLETRLLVSSTKQLQDSLKEIIGKTQNVASDLMKDAKTVNDLSVSSSDGASQISNAMEDLAQGATAMAENVQNINEQVNEMGYAIDDIAENSADLAKNSQNISIANNEASEYINKVAVSSKKSVDAVNSIAQQIKETNEAVSRINDAVEMISSIASQTNLLALNASIEAARAGEAGKGFAVVATEIKSLSEQSNNSAEDIKTIVKEIVEKSTNSVNLSNEVTEIITEEQKYIEDTQVKFSALNEEIQASIEQIAVIDNKIDTLNQAKVMITNSVSDLSAISEENAASNEEVSASVHEITNSISDISDNSNSTYQMSEDLTNIVSYFS